MTFTYKIPCFDLEQTAGSGQVFRMIPAPERTNTWQVISQGHVCFIRQENDIFFLECGPDLENFWKNYFDLNTDYEKMIASITSRTGHPHPSSGYMGNDHYFCDLTAKDDPCDPGVGGSPLQPVWDKD